MTCQHYTMERHPTSISPCITKGLETVLKRAAQTVGSPAGSQATGCSTQTCSEWCVSSVVCVYLLCLTTYLSLVSFMHFGYELNKYIFQIFFFIFKIQKISLKRIQFFFFVNSCLELITFLVKTPLKQAEQSPARSKDNR